MLVIGPATMKSLKEMIRGTVLETPARFVLRLIRRPTETERQRRGRRDDKLIRKFLVSYLRPNSCCVDIGANQGGFLEMFCRHSPNGAHSAFEPIPHLYERLVKLYGSRGVTIHNC